MCQTVRCLPCAWSPLISRGLCTAQPSHTRIGAQGCFMLCHICCHQHISAPQGGQGWVLFQDRAGLFKLDRGWPWSRCLPACRPGLTSHTAVPARLLLQQRSECTHMCALLLAACRLACQCLDPAYKLCEAMPGMHKDLCACLTSA